MVEAVGLKKRLWLNISREIKREQERELVGRKTMMMVEEQLVNEDDEDMFIFLARLEILSCFYSPPMARLSSSL